MQMFEIIDNKKKEKTSLTELIDFSREAKGSEAGCLCGCVTISW